LPCTYAQYLPSQLTQFTTLGILVSIKVFIAVPEGKRLVSTFYSKSIHD